MPTADNFTTRILNAAGVEKEHQTTKAFATLQELLTTLIPEGRYQSLVKTELEKSHAFAMRGIASDPNNWEF